MWIQLAYSIFDTHYTQMILEQIHRPDGRRCQFAKVSIEVTDLLCSYWNVSTGCKCICFFSYLK